MLKLEKIRRRQPLTTVRPIERQLDRNDSAAKNTSELHRRTCKVMSQIRKQTPHVQVDTQTAKASETWEGNLNGEPVERVVIYLRSSGCEWAINPKTKEVRPGCFDCEHSIRDTTFGEPISEDDYVEQFQQEFVKYDWTNYPILCLYNEGSMFNQKELPQNAFRRMLELIAATPEIKFVILESSPEYITPAKLTEISEILSEKIVEVGIGLETANTDIRQLCVNKKYTLQQFEQAVDLLHQFKMRALAYVLIKPSFLNECEALEDAKETVDYAFNIGVDAISLEPISVSEYAMSGVLHKAGHYRPAWLWTVLEVAQYAHPKGETRLGGYQFAPSYERHAQNCDKCTIGIKKAIAAYNSTYDIDLLQHHDCECKSDWQQEIKSLQLPLKKRIENHLNWLETKFKPQVLNGHNRKIVMCPPLYYQVEYAINDWTNKAIEQQQQVNVPNALVQWLEIYGFYKKQGLDVQVVEPKPGMHEMTFFGDSIFLYNGQAVISNFKNNCRSHEAAVAEQWAKKNAYLIRKLPEDVIFEGNAMAIRWNDKVLLGFGERTSKATAGFLSQWLNVEVIPLELKMPFFHFDVALFPLNANTLVIHKPAFTIEALATINHIAQNIIEVNEKEVHTLACNTIVHNKEVLFSAENAELKQKIEKLGYNVHSFQTNEFVKVGGGVKCLTLEHYSTH
jgi:hypothetical protein